MRIFAIKDDTLSQKSVLGFLIYYENAKAFYIELPDDADPWETPLLLSSFVKRGERSVSSYWSVYGCSSVLFPGTDKISARF